MQGVPFQIGMRVQVHWTDGRYYGAQVTAFQGGYFQVRWDNGAAPAWVQPWQLRPDSPAAAAQPHGGGVPIGAAYGSAQPYGAPQPQPHAWGAPSQQQPQPAAWGQQQPQGYAQQAAPQYGAPSGQIAKQAVQPQQAYQGPPPAQGPLQMAPAVPPAQPELPHGLVYDPSASGPGDGQSFFIFFGYKSTSETDLHMRMKEIEHLGDDVAALRAAGFRVIVELLGNREQLDLALRCEHPFGHGTRTSGVLWSGHGCENGAIEASDGSEITPEQLSKAIAERGAVRLFVMSACHTGKHTTRWQTAVGPAALVVGWGAPITIERAVDFLTPDDASSKDLDDLLLKHLGVRRVMDDGPLIEIKALAEAHARKLEELDMRYEELVTKAAEWLEAVSKPGERREFYLTVRIPPQPGKPRRTQLVRLIPNGDQDQKIVVISRVGPYTEAIDLPRALRQIQEVFYTRVYLSKPDTKGVEHVMTEAVALKRGLDPMQFGRIVMEVAMVADKLEDLFFGSDER